MQHRNHLQDLHLLCDIFYFGIRLKYTQKKEKVKP